MDLEAIERALEKTKGRVKEYEATEIGTTNERMRHSLFVSACEEIAVFHVDDLLRLVRAMRWMQDTGAWVAPSGISVPPKDWRPRTRTGWDFDGISICDDFATPLAAIEAAMKTSK